MFEKGNLHADGVKLIDYVQTAHPGERVEFGGVRGFDFFSNDPREAAELMQRMALVITEAEKPWFHTQTRLYADERLTRDQWDHIVDRQAKVLGFTDQPRLWSLHVNETTGEKHLHVAWYRVDVERGCAIDPGLFKNKLKHLSRDLEKEFALREVSNYRKAEDRARIGDRKEVEEARRLGTDVRVIRTAILDSLQQADNGKAFKAALDTQGLELANGDQRDCFVVVDREGGQHALNKKLTGLTLAETRNRLADLDRSQLPSVGQAKELQAERQAALAAQQAKEQGRGGAGAAPAPSPSRGPLNAPQPDIKPLGRTASEIRMAWTLTRDGRQFAEEIERRGLHLVYVTSEEVRASQRKQDFARAVGRQNRSLPEGFAVVDQRGSVTRIDQRVTDQKEVIEKRLGGVDRAQLLSVAEARADMRARNQAEFKTRKEAERAQQRSQQPVGKTAGAIRTAWNLSRDPVNAGRDAEQLHEALAAQGMTIARVSAAEAYESERLHAYATEIGNRAPVLKEDELVVVNGFGSVYRLDERTTGQLQPEIEARLAGIDASSLLNVADSKEVMQAAAWAARRSERQAEREQARPASAIEQSITEALQSSMSGTEFAAALDANGLAIARVSAADVSALAALRDDDRLAAAAGLQAAGRHFAELMVGDFAAVTRQGDVIRLSPQKLDLIDIEQRLADVQPRLPTVVEVRVLFESERERAAEARAQREADYLAARIQVTDAFAEKQELRQATAEAERAVHATFETPAAATDQAIHSTGRAAGGIARIVGDALSGIANFFTGGAPKLTQQQVHERAQAAGNVETQHARSVAAEEQANEEARDWQQHAQKRAQQEEDLGFAARYGTPPTREANLGRERDDGRERERER